jgi:hypothetical protein
VRREQHEVIRTLYEEDLHNYEVVVDVVSDLHNQVLELGRIDPPRRGGSRHGKRPNIARGRIDPGRSLPLIFCIHVRSGPIYWGDYLPCKKDYKVMVFYM